MTNAEQLTREPAESQPCQGKTAPPFAVPTLQTQALTPGLLGQNQGKNEFNRCNSGAVDELARCDREIARICEEARAGIGDAHGIFQGLHDWRTEKKLIAASTRTTYPNSQPAVNSATKDNPSD